MCGRYNLVYTDKFQARFAVEPPPELEIEPNYNVAPGQTMPVITNHGEKKIELMKWGLIPVWAKDINIGYKMINAKAETLAEKPTWKRPFTNQRCIVPATAFYEWKKNGKDKTPYLIHLNNDELFGFAGIYDIWHDAEGQEIKSYSIITTTPTGIVKDIHDRMPVILRQEDEDAWLDHGIEEVGFLESLLQPNNKNNMEAFKISSDVNKPSNNYKELIYPI